jgi:hypothetical protein
LLNPLFDSFSDLSGFKEIIGYINQRRNEEIEKIKNGHSKEIEKRYDRYIDYG